MLDTDVIEETINVSGVEDSQLTPNLVNKLKKNYIGRPAPKSV